MPDDGPYRKRQLKRSSEQLNHSNDSLLVGDFNFGDGPENDEFHHEYVDCYRQIYPNVDEYPGFTFNRLEVCFQ